MSKTFFLVVTFIFCGCSTLQTRTLILEFDKAVSINQKGDIKLAQKEFTGLCARRHKPSCLISGKKVSWRPNLAILQGGTSDKEASFSISHQSSDALAAYALDQNTGHLILPSQNFIKREPQGQWSVTRLVFSRLEVGHLYYLILVSEVGELVDFRQFNTLNSQAQSTQLALMSCMRDDLNRTDEMWDSVLAKNPQALFFLGDNTYIDQGLSNSHKEVSPNLIWQRHRETRNKLKIFRSFKLRPIFATWDDHDFGVGNGDKSFRYVKESQNIFRLFFPHLHQSKSQSQGPGLSQAVNLWSQQFLFLDNRSFRDPQQKNGSREHLGQKQTQWLLKKIKQSNNVSWLISGNQFFGDYQPFESFAKNHPHAFNGLIKKIKKLGKKVLFVSGDRHLSELMKIPKKYLGYETIEITSSPIHSSVYPGTLKKYPNPYRLNGIDGVWNYIILTLNKDSSRLHLKAEAFSQEGGLVFSEVLKLKK